jgi:hypothetical protein
VSDILNRLFTFLQSKGGATIAGAAGAGLTAYGVGQQQRAISDFNFRKKMLEIILRARQSDQKAALATATGSLNADPLGASQGYAQRNALMSAILPNLRPAQSRPGDPAVASAMRPAGGSMFQMGPVDQRPFSPTATLQALARRDGEALNLNPFTPTTDLGSMYGEAAEPYVDGVKRKQEQQQAAANTARAKRDKALANDGKGW